MLSLFWLSFHWIVRRASWTLWDSSLLVIIPLHGYISHSHGVREPCCGPTMVGLSHQMEVPLNGSLYDSFIQQALLKEQMKGREVVENLQFLCQLEVI